MPATRITTTTSRFVSNGPAFGALSTDQSAGADSLFIDDGAYLVATTSGQVGADLAGPGTWAVTVNGSISAGYNAYGIWLRSGITGVSTITINASGEVGTVGTAAIFADSAVSIGNAGTINGYISFNAGAMNTLTNSGKINRNYDFEGAGAEDAVKNTFTGGATTLTNTATGDIGGRVVLADGNDVVTNNGFIDGELLLKEGNNKYTSTVASSQVETIFAGGGNDTIDTAGNTGALLLGNGTNTVTVRATGFTGDIEGGSGNDTVTNYGTVFGAVFGAGINTFNNYGTFSSSDDVTGYYLKLLNTRNFFGDVVIDRGGGSVTNNGIFEGDVSGFLAFSNTKMFTGDLTFAEGTGNSFSNSGILTGSVSSGMFDIKFTNTGKLTGSATFAGGNNTFTNNGIIDSFVRLGDGNDIVTNTGRIGSSLLLGNGTNTVTNSGTMNRLTGGDNADTVSGGGLVFRDISLGAGDDKYTGGNHADKVYDGAGSDVTNLGGGDDSYFAANADITGLDKIDGGAGSDFYYGGLSDDPGYLIINIDTVFHEELQVAASIGRVEANTATGRHNGALALVGNDTIKNFENVIGSAGDDAIFGNGLVNELYGLNGSDGLFGYAGNDTIEGGDGLDAIVGGLGADKLKGGGDDEAADQFVYLKITDNGPLKAARDTILDFEDGFDRINVSVIDANTRTGTLTNPIDEAFHFLGVNVVFNANDPGGLRVIQTANGWTVEGDVNGDMKADIAIDVLDPFHNITFNAADFIL